MEKKRAFERPEIGVFYLIPDIKSGIYSILSEYDRPGKDSAHYFLWDEVIKILRIRFKKSDIDIIRDSYQGLPRGRISTRDEKSWVILHGGDFPIAKYKPDILGEFKLNDADSIGKVSWTIDNHEKMNSNEKKLVEDVLGILISNSGFKKK